MIVLKIRNSMIQIHIWTSWALY